MGTIQTPIVNMPFLLLDGVAIVGHYATYRTLLETWKQYPECQMAVRTDGQIRSIDPETGELGAVYDPLNW